MGETRETGIKGFHIFNETAGLGLGEGSWLEVIGLTITLKGAPKARLFLKNTEPIELASGEEVIIL